MSFSPRYSRITGTGSYLPPRRLTNAQMAEMLARRGLETSDEWITTRSGIRERHVAAEGETTSDLGYNAAVRAMEAAGVTAADIDLAHLPVTPPNTASAVRLVTSRCIMSVPCR